MSEPTVVDKDVVVSLAYKLTVDGEILDEAGAEDALQYLHGNENIIPGLENELTGLKVGDSKKVSVKPEDGYGLTDNEEIEEISLEDFPEGIVPEIGMELEVKDEDGNDLYGRILAITEETVTMDFNHPLAGKTLEFEVTVVGLRAATADEQAHGHVHGPDGHHHH
ncbi:MAG TPA: peptidylprolyl isomerase [Anaerolineales bacterium]|nr:peptidylprolyl isomerase [Anaerolineales bacterium]HRQ92703.1 peptidylprolyl isomerase [Anaerolineales bacterium]